MPVIYVENLSSEIRKNLCSGELTRETIEGLACSISEQYRQRERIFRKLVILLPAMTILMAVLTFFSPAAQKSNPKALVISYAFTIVVEMLILVIVRGLAVTRIPRQFARCLKKGYPELEPEFGYEQITNGSLADRKGSRQQTVNRF